MITSMQRKRVSLLFISCFLCSVSYAFPVTKADLALLPPYCKGTQLIRDISGDVTPYTEYQKVYGSEFQHLHHYCWALNFENKLRRDPSNTVLRGLISQGIGDIQYVIDQARPNYFLLPELYTAKARLLKLGKKPADAMSSLLKAIQVKQDYWPAYAMLSDLYKAQGDKANAIKVLEDGLKKSPQSKPLSRRLKELTESVR